MVTSGPLSGPPVTVVNTRPRMRSFQSCPARSLSSACRARWLRRMSARTAGKLTDRRLLLVFACTSASRLGSVSVAGSRWSARATVKVRASGSMSDHLSLLPAP